MPASKLLAFDLQDIIPITDSQVLVVNRRTLKRGVIDRQLLPLLGLCEYYRNADEHQATLATQLTDANSADTILTPLLSNLIEQGILVSAEQWLQQFPEPSEAQTPDWVLAIMTCDRPRLLQRVLHSALPHLRTIEHPPSQILLLDDSRDSEHRVDNQRYWSEWLEQVALPGSYWDRDARTHYCQRLKDTLASAEAATVDWLLSPEAFPADEPTPGQNRNLALLLSAGQRLLIMDDDCILTPQAHPQINNQYLQVGAHPLKAIPFVDQAELATAMQALDLNPLNAHLRYLGNNFKQVFTHRQQPVHDPTWLRALDPVTRKRLGPQATVGVTLNATCGDPGTAQMNWLYTRRADCHSDIAAYLQRIPKRSPTQRLFWRGRYQPLLTYADTLMTTTLTGLDNRLLLPCVNPYGRNEDQMLGQGLQALYPQALFFADSWSLPHQPEPARYWQRPTLGAPSPEPNPIEFLAQVMERGLHPTLHDPSSRLACIAYHYKDLATLNQSELIAELNRQHFSVTAAYMQTYTINHAVAPSGSSQWQRDLTLLIDQAKQNMTQTLSLSSEWLDHFRQLSRNYGKALLLWPQLRQRAEQARPSRSG